MKPQKESMVFGVKIVKAIGFIIFIGVIILTIFGALVVRDGYDMYKGALEQVSLADKVESVRAKENYTYIEDVPKIYINAVVAVEDHRFYEHCGIDVIAIARAVFNDIKALDFVEGGSTITQQLAKNMFFTQEKKLDRKVAEVFMAFDIEKNYEKDEILELYFNTSYYGDGYYTLNEACEGYFNKRINELTDYECVLLAGIPNAPSVYSLTKNPVLAKQRQKQVVDKMVKFGYLDTDRANSILE